MIKIQRKLQHSKHTVTLTLSLCFLLFDPIAKYLTNPIGLQQFCFSGNGQYWSTQKISHSDFNFAEPPPIEHVAIVLPEQWGVLF